MTIQKYNSIRQIGKSNIEPPDYRERIEKWFNDLKNQIEIKMPEKHVKSVNVFEISGEIVDVEYNYFEENEQICDATVNIYYKR